MMKQLETTQITVPLAWLKTGRYQVRKAFEVNDLRGLVQTIRADGLMTPPTVIAVGDHYELIAGDRRRRALFCLALLTDGMSEDTALAAVCAPEVDKLPERYGILKRMTAVVNLSRETDPLALRVLATIENLQRVDLSPLEKAAGFKSLLDDGLPPDQVVERTGERWATIKDSLRLLDLPEPVQRHVNSGRLPLRAIDDLVKLPPELQVEISEKMAGRTTREIKALCKIVKADPGPQPEPPAGFIAEPVKPASLRDQLAQARDLVSGLTAQLYLDSRLLHQCADMMTQTAPDATMTKMARARAVQIERALKRSKEPVAVKRAENGLKIETFIKNRSRTNGQP